MKTGLLAVGLGLALVHAAAGADSQPAFTNEMEKASYSMGVYLANNIKSAGLELEPAVVAAALKAVLGGAEPSLTPQEVQQTLQAYHQKAIDKNRQESEAFLAANAKKEGVKTINVLLPGGKNAEVQYQVLEEGKGALPGTNDLVTFKCHASVVGGQDIPVLTRDFNRQPLRSLPIRGWTEAIQRMKLGSNWRVFVPPSLALGDEGRPASGIKPAAALIFDLQLLASEPAPSMPAVSPTPVPAYRPAPSPTGSSGASGLTSDIIMVPSAADRAKGTNIQIIKAEDAARMIEAARKAEAEGLARSNAPAGSSK